MLFKSIIVGGMLLMQTSSIEEIQVPTLNPASVTAYWIAEAKAQHAQVEADKLAATAASRMDDIRKQCGSFKLVIINEERFVCSK